MSVNSKMTAIADPIRSLMGLTGTLGLDAMAAQLNSADAAVTDQTDLIAQIMAAMEGKAGSGNGLSMEFLTYTPAEDISATKSTFIEFGQTSITTPYIMAVYGNNADTSGAFAGYLGVRVIPWSGGTAKGSLYANRGSSAKTLLGKHYTASQGYFNSDYASGLRIIDGKVGWRHYDTDSLPTFYASNTYYIFLCGEV